MSVPVPPNDGPPGADTAARAAETLFGRPVERITGPGGARRASLRVHFDDHTVIASWRADPDRRAREVALLTHLTEAGADVPRPLGQCDGWSFQSDAGSRRLTSALLRRDGAARDDLAAVACESLLRLKALARGNGFLAGLSPIANGPGWLSRFAEGPRLLGAQLHRPAPAYDAEALASGMTSLPLAFIKWDARPGNAALSDDGRVIWFDWEDYGRRGGVEDAAFLVADEFWPIPAARSLDILNATGFVTPRALPLFLRFSVLHAVQRCRLIIAQRDRHGWFDPDRARRYDRIGTDPMLLAACAENAADLATRDRLTAPLSQWLERIADAARTEAQARAMPE
ncbi:MAG: hypothetical protein ABNH26_13695 [Celeribacter sp.]|jgi:hypothetical protein